MNGKFLAPINVMKAQEVLQKKNSFVTVIADPNNGEINVSVFDYSSFVGEYEAKYTSVIKDEKGMNDFVATIKEKEGERVAFIDGIDPKNLEEGVFAQYKDAFGELFQENKLYGVDFNRVVAEFLQSKGQTMGDGEMGIEAISDYFSPLSQGSLVNRKDLLEIMKNAKSTEELYKQYPFINDDVLEKTTNDMVARNRNREERTSTIENRLAYMGEALQEIGREYQILQSRENVAFNREQRNYVDSLSEEGKQKYRSEGMSGKIQILLKTRSVIPELCQDNADSYHRLMTALTNKNAGDYLIITHVATTGVQKEDLPLQFYAMALKRNENGTIDFETPPDEYQCNIKITKRLFEDRKAQVNDNKFDPFKYTGIDMAQYEKDESYSLTKEEAIKNIHNFFAKHSGTVVTIGDRFAQSQLQKIGSLPNLNNSESIDVISACMYYSYIMECEGREDENVLYGEDYKGGFRLQELANENKCEPFNDTKDRCMFALQICASTFVQYIKDNKERFPSNVYDMALRLEKQNNDEIAPVKETTPEQKQTEQPAKNEALGGLQFAEVSEDVQPPKETVARPAPVKTAVPKPVPKSTPTVEKPEQTAEASKPEQEQKPEPVQRPDVSERVPRNREPRRIIRDDLDEPKDMPSARPIPTGEEMAEMATRGRRNAFSNINQESRTPLTERPRNLGTENTPPRPERFTREPRETREPITTAPRYTSPRNAQMGGRDNDMPMPTMARDSRDNSDELMRMLVRQNELMQRMVEEQSKQTSQFLTALTSVTNNFAMGLQTMQQAIEAQRPTQEVQQAMLDTLKAMQESQTVFTEMLLDQERTNGKIAGIGKV